MHKSTYLYGYTEKQVKELAVMPYKEALLDKIEKAKGLVEKLLVNGYMAADSERIDAVRKAIKFNETLLEELKD